MLVQFNEMEEKVIPQFHGGQKEFKPKMFVDEHNKILYGKLEPGASIGLHTHDTNSEIIYILQGAGKALYDEGQEEIGPGSCHYCPKGHAHGLVNDGAADLLFFAVVPEHG